MRGFTLSLCAALLLTGCAAVDDRGPTGKGGGSQPWASANGDRAKHTYRFYPSAGVYENVHAGTYYYMSGGRWMAKKQLPPSIRLASHAYVSLELATVKPYLHYNEHMAKFNGK